MRIARTLAELSDALDGLRRNGARVALVPTMGALHDGHLSLLDTARRAVRDDAASASRTVSGAHPPDISKNGAVVASIFVNPTQFGDAADLARYPRDEAGDAAKLERAGCDLLWMPGVDTMYPHGDATTVEVAGPALGFEGAARPRHFRGVATVVAKLFGQVRPDAACFGQKDYQQLQVIRRMVRDLALPVTILGVPTCRESDGLAMSSRNRFLSAEDRMLAPRLFATLQAAAAALAAGARVAPTLDTARGVLARQGFGLEYLAFVSRESLTPLLLAEPGARLIVAARLGSVRLLDNLDAG